MPRGEIEAIMFDLGKVLLDFDHRKAAQRIARVSAKPARDAYRLFFDSALTARFESGQISPRDFFLKVKAALGVTLTYRDFVPLWNDIFFFTPENKRVLRAAFTLRKRYKVVLVSNINVLHLNYVKKTFPVLSAFDRVVASCHAGVIKPHRGIYEKALARIGARAESTFYTDDRKELVESACAMGLRGYVFRGFAKLRRDLSRAGVRL
jgi:glucose-1-phosphatase